MAWSSVVDIGEIGTDIKLPDQKSNIEGAIDGEVRFTAAFETALGIGHGYLNTDAIADYSEEDEWLVELFRLAAKEDGRGTDSQLLIGCLGTYEEDENDQLSDSSTSTLSYHADWWRSAIDPVYVKVDWELRDSGEKTIIDIQPYFWYDRNGQWECRFEQYEDNHPFRVKIYYTEGDGGLLDDAYYATVNGTTVVDGNMGDVAGEIRDYLADKIESRMPEPYSGFSDMWVTIDNYDGSPKQEGIYWFLEYFDVDYDTTTDVVWEPSTTSGYDYVTEFSLTFGGMKSEDRQIYSRVFSAWQPNEVKLKINKSIKNKNNYSSNFFDLDEYDLTNTEFWLYTSDEGSERIKDSDGNYAVMTIPNATGGISNEIKLEAKYGNQTVYLEEKLPSTATGYKTQYNKAGSRYALTLPAAGKSHTEPIENEPLVDPAFLKIKKVSPQTNSGKPAADIHYEGIEYTLAYFGERSNSESNARFNTGAIDTWKFETDENGRIDFTDEAYKISGDTLYKVDGETQYPVGWYRIWESSPSNVVQDKGLEVSKHFYCVHIKNDNNDLFDIFIDGTTTEYKNPHGNTASAEIEETREGEIFEPERWEPFAFAKKDIHLSSGKPEGDTKLEGAVFTVYSEDANRFADVKNSTYDGHTYSIGSGNVVLVDGNKLTITIDSDGRGICKYPLPKTDNTIGKRFYITETTAPLGYKANDVKYYVDFQNRITVKDYNDNTISLSIKNIETGTTSNETEIYSITYGANNLNVNEVSVPYVNGSAYNTPRKGIIEIEKFDDDYGAVRNKYFFVQFAEKI